MTNLMRFFIFFPFLAGTVLEPVAAPFGRLQKAKSIMTMKILQAPTLGYSECC